MPRKSLSNRVFNAVAKSASWQQEKGDGYGVAKYVKMYCDDIQRHLSSVIPVDTPNMWATRVDLVEQEDLTGDPLIATGKIRTGVFGVCDEAAFLCTDISLARTRAIALEFGRFTAEPLVIEHKGNSISGVRVLESGVPDFAFAIHRIPGVGERRRRYRDLLIAVIAERTPAAAPE